MKCIHGEVVLTLMQIIVTMSLVCVTAITLYIFISKRQHIYAYQLILWITISQSIVYLSIYPYRWNAQLSSTLCIM
jgi:hypothetical protein